MTRPLGTQQLRLNAIDLIRDGSISPIDGAGVAGPIGSRFYGAHGLPWMKSGVGDTDWSQMLVRSPYFNVKEFGAVGDGVTNDRPAIQLAIDAAAAAGGGVVFFPVGRYSCTVFAAPTIVVFQLSGVTSGKILFMGVGRASSVFMAGDALSNDKVLFEAVAGARHVGWRNLELHSELANEDEQTHLIQLRNAVTATSTGRCFVTDCYFGHARGDAIRMLGNGTPEVVDALVKRNIFEMDEIVGQRSRSCVSIQRSTRNITIDINYMDGASPLDMEPTGSGSIERFRFTRNVAPTRDVAISGNGLAEEDMDTIVAGNTLLDGSVAGGDVGRGRIIGNIIDFRPADPGQNEPNINLFERITQMIVADNICYRGGLATPSVSVVRVSNQGPVGDNEGLLYTGNLVIDDRDSIDNGCIQFTGDPNRCNVRRNLCLLRISAVNNGVCILIDGGTAPAENNVIAENMGIGTNAVIVQPFQGFDGNVSIVDNFGRHAASGVRFTDVSAAYIAARNVFPDLASNVIALPAGVDYVVVDQIASLTVPCVIMAIDDPEGNIPAAIGSIALRSTGGGAGTTFYVKEADSGLTSGWDAK